MVLPGRTSRASEHQVREEDEGCGGQRRLHVTVAAAPAGRATSAVDRGRGKRARRASDFAPDATIVGRHREIGVSAGTPAWISLRLTKLIPGRERQGADPVPRVVNASMLPPQTRCSRGREREDEPLVLQGVSPRSA